MTPPGSGRKRAAKHIAIYSAGSIIRQLAGFIMLPIYTSYLTPEDYGVIGLLVVMIGVFELFLGARLTQSVPKYYYEAETENGRKRVVTTALVLTVVISTVSTILLSYYSSPISSLLFGTLQYEKHVMLYCVLLLTTAIEAYGVCYLRLQERPYLFITISIGKLILQLSLNIYFVVVLDMGAMGVVISTVIASSVWATLLLVYTIYFNGLNFQKTIAFKMIAFCWPLWVAGVAALYMGSASRYYLRILSDLSEVGLFELATKFGAILGLLIWNPFSQWWQTEKFKVHKNEHEGTDVYPVVFNAMACVIVMAAFGLAVFSSPVIELMSSEAFHPAKKAAPFLIYAVMIENMALFFLLSFMLKERTIVIAYIRYFSAATMTVLFFALIPNFGFVGAAMASLANSFIVFTLYYFVSRRVFDLKIKVSKYLTLVLVSLVILWLEGFVGGFTTSLLSLYLVKISSCLLVLSSVAVFVITDPKLNEMARSAIYIVYRKRYIQKIDYRG